MIVSLSGLAAASDVTSLITSTAQQYGVPPQLALAVAQKESGLNQGAVGAAGEIGLFQLMPATAAGLKVNPSDVTQNVQGGVQLLSQLYSQYGDWNTALIAYNEGPGALAANGPYAVSQNYAASILSAAGMDTTSPDSGTPADDSGTTDATMFSTPMVIGIAAVVGLGLYAALR